MEPRTSKKLILGLTLSLAVISLLLGMCCFKYIPLGLRVAFAEEQTQIFDEMRTMALQSNPDKAVEYLEYAVTYYPSGTKQISGSRLDRIVERARQAAIREMIADLRAKTGHDFGDDPNLWINELKTRK